MTMVLLRSLRRTDRPAPEYQTATRRSTNRRSPAMTLMIFLLVLIFGTTPLFAADGQNVSQRVMRLINQIDQLEKTQQEIIASENRILDEIKNLKIQARR